MKESSDQAHGEVPLWTVSCTVPKHQAPLVWEALEPFAEGLTSFEQVDDPEIWDVVAYCAARPPVHEVIVAVTALLGPDEVAPEPSVVRLPDTDWLAENRKSFPAIQAGHFLVLPWDWNGVVPGHQSVIRLNAGAAFGSGSHETTRGCLQAISDLEPLLYPRHILDLGTGSGILAIAAAKQWQQPVLATDNDPIAIDTALENALRNGVARLVSGEVREGCDGIHLPQGFDLILANILARPLAEMAGDIARLTVSGGRVVLSGLLANQEAQVFAPYRAAGLVLSKRYSLEDWVTLVLKHP